MTLSTLTLKRIHSNLHRTFGVLIGAFGPFAVTLEDPWNQNRRNISCIPPGNYVCQRVNSPKFGDTFEVTKVPGRSHILFHKGNTEEDTHGCILVGEEFGVIRGEPGILASGRGYGEFMEKMRCKSRFLLTIKECC